MTTETPTLNRRADATATREPRRAAVSPRKGEPWIAPAKVAVFIAAWYPLLRLVFLGFTDGLGADPIRFITWSTGLWTLVFLCITLGLTLLAGCGSVHAQTAASTNGTAIGPISFNIGLAKSNK